MRRPSPRLATPPTEALRRVRAEKARRSLLTFVRLAWPIAEPATPLIEGWHVGAICEHLEAVTRGEIRRLLINVPPGHAKSLLVSVLWPAWVWTARPEWRGLFVSHSEKLSFRDSIKCRSVIESDWYREWFSGSAGWQLSDDQNAKGLFTNTRSGLRMALGITGGNTGFRGNAVVMDDPIAAGEAFSKPARDEVIRRWDYELSNRLNVPDRDALVIIMQRLHDEDLSGHLLARGGYEHLCLPTEFEPERRSVTYHVVAGSPASPPPATLQLAGNAPPTALAFERRMFWQDPREQAGELLFPALYTPEVIDNEKRRGSHYFVGQHQQRPSPAGGSMFQIAWWRFWKPDGTAPDHIATRPHGCYAGPARPLPKCDRVLISVDASFKQTVSGSFVAMHVWGAAGADRFLLDRVHARMDFDATCKALVSLAARWPLARQKIIEGKANGSAIVSQLSRRLSGLIEVEPEGGKEARAAATQPYVAAGNVHLPDGAPWLDEYIAEHAAFPLGRTDDDVDAQSQALQHLEGRAAPTFSYPPGWLRMRTREELEAAN